MVIYFKNNLRYLLRLPGNMPNATLDPALIENHAMECWTVGSLSWSYLGAPSIMNLKFHNSIDHDGDQLVQQYIERSACPIMVKAKSIP